MSKQVIIQMIEESTEQEVLIVCETNVNLFIILERILTQEELVMFFYSYEKEENDV